MAKTKNKNIKADVLSSKKSTTKSKKHNPFEVHVNKEKFSILGRQLKHDRGMPGISRSKAIKRRKDTLGQEYLQQNKNNKFKDKRIGEKSMSREEAANARFVAERLNNLKSNKKHSLFNLNDDEMLTHKGQTLAEIEQFQDPTSDNESDEEIDKLDAEFTSTAHFGGDVQDINGKSRKTAIDDLIADQKRRKHDISKEKDEVSEMTQLLDQNWKSLIPLMGKLNKDDEVKPKADAYDRALREMIFERRGDVSDKLKSEAEIIKTEKDRLEILERERIERMHGLTEEDKKMKHRSADDLDDGYFLQPVEDEKTLAYDINAPINGHEDDSDTDNDIEEFDKNCKQTTIPDKDSNANDDDSNEDETESSSEEEEDNLSDLKDSSDEETPETITNKHKMSESESIDKKSTKSNKIIAKRPSEQERKVIMAKAAAELPYTFELPESYEELEKLLKNKSSEYQHVIFERMIKCNHPKVIPENKQKMIMLFAYMLQHLNDTFERANTNNIEDCFMILDRICPHLYDIAHINPIETTNCFKEVIKEKQHDFRENTMQYPTMDTIVFLKIISYLYTTSDFYHVIVTPSFIFLSQMLSKCQITQRSDIANGLFLATIVLEYTQLSKRFLPAALNFLVGVLFLCIKKRPIEVYKVVPPFKSTGPYNSLLVLSETFSKTSYYGDSLLKSIDLVETEIDDSFKVRALNTTLKLSCDFLTLLSDNAGARYLAAPFEHMCDKIDAEIYPTFIKDTLEKCQHNISEIKAKKLIYMEEEVAKPKALRMMEPKFDKVYDDKRNRNPGMKNKSIREGMIRKVKSETRGAVREIRKDNAFIAKIQLKKQMESDAERKEKVKRIFSEASIQQGELKALERKKKHL